MFGKGIDEEGAVQVSSKEPARRIAPLGGSVGDPSPRTSNRGTSELESPLTRFRINTRASSNRGQFGHPMRMAVLSEQREPKDLLSSYSPPARIVVLLTLNDGEGFTLNEREGSEQREPKDLFRNCDPLFFASHRPIGTLSSGHDGICPERSALFACRMVSRNRGSRAETCPKSGFSTPEAARRMPLFPAFLIDTACQLEINLTPAKSARIPFLIVAEMRLCTCASRARNFASAATTVARRRSRVQSSIATGLKRVARLRGRFPNFSLRFRGKLASD